MVDMGMDLWSGPAAWAVRVGRSLRGSAPAGPCNEEAGRAIDRPSGAHDSRRDFLARGREHLRDHLADRGLEWFSAFVMVAWGVTLALPGDTLAAPSFGPFHRFGLTETFWAWMFGTVGTARIVALYINGTWPTTPYIRMAGALFGALSWSQVAFLVTEGWVEIFHSAPTGTGVYGLLALADLVSIHRAAYDVRYYAR
jgi:hypothetical protein